MRTGSAMLVSRKNHTRLSEGSARTLASSCTGSMSFNPKATYSCNLPIHTSLILESDWVWMLASPLTSRETLGR